MHEYLVVEAWVNGHPFEDEDQLSRLLDAELYCEEFDDRLPKRMIQANRLRIDGRERVVVPPATVLSPTFGALHDPEGGFSYVVFETKTVGLVSIFDLDTGDLIEEFESDPPSSVGRIIGFSPQSESRWCVRVEDA